MDYLKNVVSLALDAAACTGCGRCLEVCPHAVFVLETGRSRISRRDACMECGACARNCAASALQVRTGVGCADGMLRGMVRRAAPWLRRGAHAGSNAAGAPAGCCHAASAGCVERKERRDA